MPPSSPLRADAARNRERVLAAATRAFAVGEEAPTMRAIADAAGVGVGTLYRHFPTRESLVDAIYVDQADRLDAGAHDLLLHHQPAEAMRLWMDLFADWLATKRGMLGTLRSPGPGVASDPVSRTRMLSALGTLLEAGAAAGVLRADVEAEDVAAALVGTFLVAGGPDARPQASRLLDILMDGLRHPSG